MAWNFYKNVRRKVGCELRVNGLSSVIVNAIPKENFVVRVEVASRDNGKAVLRVWSSLGGRLTAKRFTVDIVVVAEDPNWIVERN